MFHIIVLHAIFCYVQSLIICLSNIIRRMSYQKLLWNLVSCHDQTSRQYKSQHETLRNTANETILLY